MGVDETPNAAAEYGKRSAPVAVLRMRPDDIPACLSVIAAAWDTRTAQAAENDLVAMFRSAHFPPTFYIAVDTHTAEVVGLSGYVTSWMNWGVWDLIYTAVHPDARRRDIGRRLVARGLQDADALDCDVMLTTHVPGFYRSHGFEVLADDLRCAGKSNVLMLRRSRSQREAQA